MLLNVQTTAHLIGHSSDRNKIVIIHNVAYITYEFTYLIIFYLRKFWQKEISESTVRKYLNLVLRMQDMDSRASNFKDVKPAPPPHPPNRWSQIRPCIAKAYRCNDWYHLTYFLNFIFCSKKPSRHKSSDRENSSCLDTSGATEPVEYCNLSVPFLSKKKVVLKPIEVAAFLFGKDTVPSVRFQVHEHGTFIVNLPSLKSTTDVKCDDIVIWNNNSNDKFFLM